MINGYKDSELGLIPSDWKISKLEKLVSIESGVSPSLYEFCENGSSMFYKVNQLNDFDKYMKVSPYQFNFNSRKNIPANSIAFPKRGASIFTNKVRVLSFPAMVDTNIMCLIPKKEINYEFLFYFLIDFGLSKIADTSSIPQINNKHIYPIKIALPPIDEQKKIAEILSTVDDKIEVIDQQIIETQELKKGLMQRLLTKGIGHTEFKDSSLGMIPKSWEIVKLSDVCHKIGDGIHSTPKYVDNSDYYFVNGNNLINGTLTVSDKTKCVSKDEYEKLRIKLNVNSILMSINGTIGNLAMYQNEHVVFGKSASYISANEDRLHYLFLYYFLQHSNTKKYFYDELTGSTIQNLSLKTIRNTPTILPSKTEQEKISYILGSVDEKLEVLSEKKNHYQELKQGLMQQLLTGKIRVKV